MTVKRRDFFAIAGLSAIGLASGATLGQRQRTDTTRLREPKLGERWAMVVNLDACRKEAGCRDCIAACHQSHNVPDFGNPKDDVKWIWKEEYDKAFPNQHHEYMSEASHGENVPVFCNHCDNPPCTRVCPTQATWKRDDGIVMMDWHRCIGCRYCIAACPYGSRSFNWRDPRPFIEETNPDFPTRTRGVVEKCNFCDERLAKGQIPACVEACETDCLTFGDLEDPDSRVRELLRSRHAVRRKPGLGTQPQVYYLV